MTRESEADFRKRPCGKQPREDERSEVKFGFGSKVRGRKTRDAKKNRRKAICRRFFVAERDSRKRGGLSKAPLRQAAERRRAQRSQIRIRLESPRSQTRDAKKNRRKAICRRFFVAERDSRKRGGLSKAPLRQAAERRRAQRSQIRIRLESPRSQTRDAKKNRRKAICWRFSRGGNRTPAGQGKS